MAQTESIVLQGWPGGLNTESDPLQIEPDELAEALNVDVGLSGSVSKRKGYAQYDDDSLDAESIEHLTTWQRLGGSEYLVGVADDGDIWYGAGTAFSEGATAWAAAADVGEYPVAFASLDNILYVSSLRGNTYKFDGTTWSAVSDITLDESGTEFPRARHLVSLHERMFALNVEVNAGVFRSRMYFSEPGDPETWGPTSWIDFQPDDGQEITAAVAFGENVMVFKNHAIHLLSGTDENSFTRYPIDSKIGTESPGTVVPDGNVIRFFDVHSGVWEFDGASFSKIDDKINTYLLENVNYGQHHKARAWLYRSKYYLSVPWDSDTYNSRTFVYDTRTKAWVEWDYGALGYAEYGRTPVAGGVDGGTNLFELNSGLTDNGATISAAFKTGWLSPKSPAVKHRLRRLDVAFSALADVDVSLDMYRDFNSDPYVQKTVNTDPGGMIWGSGVWGTSTWGGGDDQVYTRDTGWGKRWRTMAIRVSEATATGEFQVNRAAAHITAIGTVRGSSDN